MPTPTPFGYFDYFKANTQIAVWRRGTNCEITSLEYMDEIKILSAMVQGSYGKYTTTIKFYYGSYYGYCNCAFEGNGYCKHIASLCMEARNREISFVEAVNIIDVDDLDGSDSSISDILKERYMDVDANKKLQKLQRLKSILTGQAMIQDSWYPAEDVKFYTAFNLDTGNKFTKKNPFTLGTLKITRATNKATDILIDGVLNRFSNGSCNYCTQLDYDFVMKKVYGVKNSFYGNYSYVTGNKLTPDQIFAVLQNLRNLKTPPKLFINEQVAQVLDGQLLISVESTKKSDKKNDYQVNVTLRYKEDNTWQSIAVNKKELRLLGGDSYKFLLDTTTSKIWILENRESFDDLEFVINNSFKLAKDEVLDIAKSTEKLILPPELEIPKITVDRIEPILYLEEKDNNLIMRLGFDYLGQKVDYDDIDDKLEAVENDKTVWLMRNNELETRHKNYLQEHCQEQIRSDFYIAGHNVISGEDVVLLLSEVLAKLTNWQVLGQHKLKNNYQKAYPKMRLDSGIDWLNLSGGIDFGGQEVSLADIVKMVKKNKRFVDLKNGSKGVLPKDWLEQNKEMLELGELNNKGELQVSKWHLSLLENFAKINDTTGKWKTQIDSFLNFQEIQTLPKPNLNAILRDYQQTGYEWLWFLYSNRLGGILADDMGLGKTLQAIAFLNKVYFENTSNPNYPRLKGTPSQDGNNKTKKPRKNAKIKLEISPESKTTSLAPTLLIVPKTLIFNWQNELLKFAPNLTATVLHGNQNRDLLTLQTFDTNLVITTYGTALKEIESLQKIQWHCLIMDESQQIKNPESLTYKAIKLIKANHRFALSGTPVENNLEDIWSQLSVLNPGMLGSREWFRSNFLLPIQKHKDQDKATKLKNLIYPFVLRRLKQDVAKELGDKVENLLVVEMEPKQRLLYDKIRLLFKKQIEEEFDDNKFLAKMKILEGLTKLRQVCCHPRLLDTTSNIESAKLEMMLETLDDIVAEGHKVLIFSQFTSMLSIVKEELDKRQITYSYLDGKTNNRQKVVDEFNNASEIPVFLISLKAGGVGLNLTSADYVFIYDPWWNPAVESQAVDRSHRIGQDKTVFVYRFVVKDTVEEKILELQATKQELVKNIVSVDESLMKKLDKTDLTNLFG